MFYNFYLAYGCFYRNRCLVGKTKVKFIVNSDAHSPSRVGDVNLVKGLIDDGVINKEQIVGKVRLRIWPLNRIKIIK